MPYFGHLNFCIYQWIFAFQLLLLFHCLLFLQQEKQLNQLETNFKFTAVFLAFFFLILKILLFIMSSFIFCSVLASCNFFYTVIQSKTIYSISCVLKWNDRKSVANDNKKKKLYFQQHCLSDRKKKLQKLARAKK